MLFALHLTYETKKHIVAYETIAECLGDDVLRSLLDAGARCSLWSGKLCVAPDIRGNEGLRRAVVNNATTLLMSEL